MKKKFEKKAVKSFTVDERVYTWLVERLKEADIGISVSSIIDGYLKYLYQGLREVVNFIERKKIKIPLSFVIYKYMDDRTLFYQYDWEAIEKADLDGYFRKEIDKDVAEFVNEAVDEFKKAHKKRWKIDKKINEIDRSSPFSSLSKEEESSFYTREQKAELWAMAERIENIKEEKAKSLKKKKLKRNEKI